MSNLNKYVLSWDCSYKDRENAVMLTQIKNDGAMIIGKVVFSSTAESGAVLLDDIEMARTYPEHLKTIPSPPSPRLLRVAVEIYKMKDIDGLSTAQILQKITEIEGRFYGL